MKELKKVFGSLSKFGNLALPSPLSMGIIYITITIQFPIQSSKMGPDAVGATNFTLPFCGALAKKRRASARLMRLFALSLPSSLTSQIDPVSPAPSLRIPAGMREQEISTAMYVQAGTSAAGFIVRLFSECINCA